MSDEVGSCSLEWDSPKRRASGPNLLHLPILWNSLRRKVFKFEDEIIGWLIRRRFLAKNRTCFADFLWILVQNAPSSPVRTRICRRKSFLSSHLQRNRYALRS
ncbi:hypothetical protein B5K05_19415 [Rhizobium phaseoli]|nr:hypothetical protein RPHASCH2410_CH16095 [Rhizobium phaseoli Ch24-10]RDJ07745.1 hypothetical protein B5K04_19370 [Rhizobium phaseoli]RDJ10049.1 hypothetical protein B5K05_19415 [Rhizobium phaseoli]